MKVLENLNNMKDITGTPAAAAFERIIVQFQILYARNERKKNLRIYELGRTCRACSKTDEDTPFAKGDLCDNCYRRGSRLGWCNCGRALYTKRACECNNIQPISKD